MMPLGLSQKTTGNLKKTVLVIGGATGSGKSRLAFDLARAINGVIINADSLQLYSSLPILTAHPTQDDQECVPHRLYGVLSSEIRTTAPYWTTLARHEIQESHLQNKIPIFVGGTGFYLKALMEGLSPIPEIPLDIKEKSRALLTEHGLSFLFKDLQAKDPHLALHPHDTQRILRAWEVITYTQKPLSFWQKHKAQDHTSLNFFKIVLMPPRPLLDEALQIRSIKMLQTGALEEVENLQNLVLSASHPLKKAIGVLEIEAYLKKDISLEDTLSLITTKTRQYAKRQSTWFTHQLSADILFPFLYTGEKDHLSFVKNSPFFSSFLL